MATKTDLPGQQIGVESEHLDTRVEVEADHAGTAISLVRALEAGDERLASMQIETGINGARKVTVRPQDGDLGAPGAVPATLHDQLREWDFEHVGEGGGATYAHTDEGRSHVYRKR